MTINSQRKAELGIALASDTLADYVIKAEHIDTATPSKLGVAATTTNLEVIVNALVDIVTELRGE